MSQACREKWAVHIKHRKSAGVCPKAWETKPLLSEEKLAEREAVLSRRIAVMLEQQNNILKKHGIA